MDKPFTTDGCSGFMSFFWRTVLRKPPPWEGCCFAHDKTYWQGGPKELRLKADTEVMRCVAAGGEEVPRRHAHTCGPGGEQRGLFVAGRDYVHCFIQPASLGKMRDGEVVAATSRVNGIRPVRFMPG